MYLREWSFVLKRPICNCTVALRNRLHRLGVTLNGTRCTVNCCGLSCRLVWGIEMCISKELHILLFSLCDLCRIGFQSMGEERIYCHRYVFSSCQTRGKVDAIILVPEKEQFNTDDM